MAEHVGPGHAALNGRDAQPPRFRSRYARLARPGSACAGAGEAGDERYESRMGMSSRRDPAGLRAVALAVAACLAVVAGGPATAGKWKEHAVVRLIDGGPLPDGASRLAGVEVTLDPGWKTYWRQPGDSGIPPSFDFTGSDNVAEVVVEWPAPEAHFDGYGWILGYTDTVIFPLRILAEDAARPVQLKLYMHYGVCKDICVPAEAEVAATLDGGAVRTAAIDFHRRRVPVRVEAGDPRGGVVSAQRVGPDDARRLDLTVRFADAKADALVVVEDASGRHLAVPEPVGRDAGGRQVFSLPLDDLPDGAGEAGTPLTVTGVSPSFSFEQAVTLD